MLSFLSRIGCGLVLLQSCCFSPSTALPHGAAVAAAAATPHYFQRSDFTRRDLSPARVQRELGQMLSNGSLIFGPSAPEYADAIERWNVYTEGDVEVVVQPAQETDISKIVKYCNKNSIPFLAQNRGHGASQAIATFKGLQINLKKLTGVTIQPGAKSAHIQAGAYIGEVIPTLWDAGYVTSTGSADCVGFAGPALGGGHGRYQGLYGLASDNFIRLNVVLADGSTITVSEQSHSDLFWGMKGAGHNFGIVTSAESKIYPRQIDTWHYHNYVWTQDKLEVVFQRLNEFHRDGNTPPKMGVEFGHFSVDPSTNHTEPVLTWNFAYAGPAAEAEKLLKPFNAIKSIREETGDVPYPQIPAIQRMDINSPTCSSNSYVGSSAGLQKYNVTTQREIYRVFNETVTAYPGIGIGGTVFYEGYSTKAVMAIDPKSSAYPHRDDLHLVFFTTAILQPELKAPAQKLADRLRDLWYASQPGRLPTTYVNYATGSESLQSIYGYEPWRLERLLGLKAKYDPKNRFRFYVPLIPAKD